MELHALLVIEFDAFVDRISREMFAERLASFEWQRDAKVPSAWTLCYEERSTRESALRSANNCLNLACERGRIKREQIRALVHFGPEATIQV